ncbi:unnamed protein product [Didymodactylos carnosus]|uniref:Uncharacterized protein n=1 Tax=Didymodactylos carnosus TaxID=1234261 RepID=A0A8S2FTE9_9BILA|nr:unnamed protein product [Didymodactylos carnosus]CAF4330433.1 unnamed protein product [Didymodactylos carnosus]
MLPVQKNDGDKWAFAVDKEVRVKLMLGNSEVEELARKAIENKYDLETSKYSKFWTVAPLMIDSLTAYVVKGSNSPVEGVRHFPDTNPNALSVMFRFECSSNENAQEVVDKLAQGYYEIEIAFYFAGFKQITTNFLSITTDQLRSVLSKTIVDGGNTNAQYIHRNQGSTFVSKYVTNVKKMIYLENANANLTSLTNGLEDQFTSLLQQASLFSR